MPPAPPKRRHSSDAHPTKEVAASHTCTSEISLLYNYVYNYRSIDIYLCIYILCVYINNMYVTQCNPHTYTHMRIYIYTYLYVYIYVYMYIYIDMESPGFMQVMHHSDLRYTAYTTPNTPHHWRHAHREPTSQSTWILQCTAPRTADGIYAFVVCRDGRCWNFGRPVAGLPSGKLS